MTEGSEPKLTVSGSDPVEHTKARHSDLPDLSQMSPVDIVNYLKGRYLKPRWPHWHNMGEVLLQHAVWLSLNVEPFGDELDAQKGAQGISTRLAPVMRRYDIYLIDDLRESYDQRMKQCIANIGTGKLPSRVTYWVGHAKGCFVKLDSFRQWGESLPSPYIFPDEFPRPAPAAPKIPAILTEEGALTPYVSTPARSSPTPEEKIMLQVARAAWSAGTPPAVAPAPGESPAPSVVHRGRVTWDGEYHDRLKEALSPLEEVTSSPEAPAHVDDEKVLGTRERNTLLTIIAALCKELSIDVSQPSKAAAAIESLTTKIRARVAQRTIENHLKRIPEALESKSD